MAEFFKDHGFTIIDADKIAHEVLDSQHKKIAELFGETFVNNGKVDRKALGAVVFADKEKRKMLEELVHPLIYQEIERRSIQQDKQKKPYFVDIPLFFETARYPIKRSLLVYTTKELQLKRLMQRDGYNTQNAQQRIEAQMPIDEKRERASYIIENIGDLAQLEAECARVMKEIIDDSNKIFG